MKGRIKTLLFSFAAVALTALGFSLGDQLELHNVMGLMLPDVRVMIGADDAAPARWEQLKAQLKEEYAGAAERTASGLRRSSKRRKSGWPSLTRWPRTPTAELKCGAKRWRS